MTPTRIAAAAAALTLIGVSVFGVAISAIAGPAAAPVITAPVSGPDSDDQPQVEGDVAEEGLTVTVQVTNSLGTYTYCTDPGATIAAGFSCASGAALPYGDNTFTATSEYTSGSPDALPSPVSNSVLYTHWQATGTVQILDGPPTTSAHDTVTFSGVGPALGTVALYEANILADQFCAAGVAADGTWECTTTGLGVGSYDITNFAGFTEYFDGTPAPFVGPPNYLFDLVAATPPTIDPLVPYTTVNTTQPGIQGDQLEGSELIVIEVADDPGFASANAYCTVPVSAGATIWFCANPSGTLPTLGTNYLRATAWGENGTVSAPGPTVTIEYVESPTVTLPADEAFTSDNTPTFTGASTGIEVDVIDTALGFICNGAVSPGDIWSCTPTPLADGVYEYYPRASHPDLIYGEVRHLTVDTVAPVGPVITGPGTTTTSTHPVITGTAEPFATIVVYRDGMPAACQEGTVTANSAGAWSCTSSASLGVGTTFAFGALQVDRAGNASTAGVPPAQLSVTVVPPTPTPAPVQAPTPRVFLPWSFQFAAAGDEFAPGDTTRLTGSGLPVGALVEIEFHSTPVAVGSTTVADDGTFDVLVTIPEDAAPGAHRFVVLVTPTEGLPSVQEQAVTVVLPTRALETPTDTVTAHAAESGTGGADRSDPAAPSGLTGSIQTLGGILANPVVIGTAALSGLALLLLVAFPAELLNSTISEQYQRFARRVPRLTALERFTNWLERMPWLGALLITVIAAVIFGFADPGFGFDVTSLRVVLACAIALFIVGYLASAISGAIIRSRWHVATTLELKPLGLVLTVAGVVLSRLLDFSPGFLIGLLLGIGLIGRTTARERAKATLVQAGVVFALAMLGWVGYSVLMAGGEPDTFASALAVDTLVAVTTEGLTALFIGLLPLRLLDGSAIFEHSKLAWAAAYTVAAAAFVLIVVPSAWGQLDGSLWTWITVLGGFAIIAIGLYVYFRFVAPAPEEHDEEVSAEPSGAKR